MEGKAFVDSRIDLTGKRVRNCTFDGCVLVLNRSPKTHIKGIVVNSCLLEGEGWPINFIEMVIKADGGRGFYGGKDTTND